jgi:DNA-binding PadR family transcriptional regulator
MTGLPSPTQMVLLEILTEHDELPGREVAKQFKSKTGKNISYGTLYTTLRRLKEQQWVEVRDDEDQDGRVRFFSIDVRGRAVLAAAQRYQDVAAAKSWKPRNSAARLKIQSCGRERRHVGQRSMPRNPA